MGTNASSCSMRKINFEDMKQAVRESDKYVIINTLPNDQQDCLICNTTSYQEEERIINTLMKKNKHIKIIIYGKHCNDDKIYNKYNQMTALGFYQVFVYTGGLFEWLMLQDIFGMDEFPTTKRQLDFLKYRPHAVLHMELLSYSSSE